MKVTMDELLANIKEAKKELKEAKREFGKHSVEAVEARETLDSAKDSLDFYLLHT